MENENTYLLELNFDDEISPPWMEKHYPDDIDSAKKIIERAKSKDDSFVYAELYETKLVNLD